MRVPAQKAIPAGVPKLRFECDNCGKAHVAAPEYAGRKTVCSNCGVKFRIPSGNSSVVESTAVQHPSKPPPKQEPPAPVDLDVYGLEDEPTAPAPLSGGTSPGEPSIQAGSASQESPPLPSRLQPYQALSEKKKKQIAKRADKLNRMKPSNAGIGISFGAVLGFALIGWRFYRIMHRFERAAARGNAVQSAPVEAVDLKSSLAETDQNVAQMIAKPGTAEARDWLDTAKHPNHRIVGMSTENARTMVAGFYERGAKQVYVLVPITTGNGVMTNLFAVELPQEPAQRSKCFEWVANCPAEEQLSAEQGLKYLLISTD